MIYKTCKIKSLSYSSPHVYAYAEAAIYFQIIQCIYFGEVIYALTQDLNISSNKNFVKHAVQKDYVGVLQ